MTDLIDTTEMYLRTILELEEEGITPHACAYCGTLRPFRSDRLTDRGAYGKARTTHC